jgi:hypothetical protein
VSEAAKMAMGFQSGYYFRGGMQYSQSENRLADAWRRAMQWAGEGGKIATMPEIVAARKNATWNSIEWSELYTTRSAEYVGLDRNGEHKIVVAHGVGPMATLEGALKAYSRGPEDGINANDRWGGRITQYEFWDLLDGKYGPVEVVDLVEYARTKKHPFIQKNKAFDAKDDKLIRARLGGPLPDSWLHYWIRVEGANSNFSYGHSTSDSDEETTEGWRWRLEDGFAFAHLLSVSGLINKVDAYCRHCHEWGCDKCVGGRMLTGAELEIGCLDKETGVRMVGIRANGDIANGILTEPDMKELLEKHWRDCMLPSVAPRRPFLMARLMKVGGENNWFTMYSKNVGKKARRADTGKAEFRVIDKKPVGGPKIFRTTTECANEEYFVYYMNEVIKIAPRGANAYFLSNPERVDRGEGELHWHDYKIQFYKVKVDYGLRLMTPDQLFLDYDTQMKLLALGIEED